MRGKHVQRFIQLPDNRIIPAHAGQTRSMHRFCGLKTDHPRACGANRQSKLCCPLMSGSSPRMRGKHVELCEMAHIDRIIPAHAGQMRPAPAITTKNTDHPRACGANASGLGVMEPLCGSSPRMRGKHVHARLSQLPERIIPAHAGQTHERLIHAFNVTDHPRACGANDPDIGGAAAPLGSSPRMRGKPSGYQRTRSYGRIIPAHAGQTTASTPDTWS